MIDENFISLSFLGDISLNDDYNVLYERGEKPFKQIGSILNKSDLVVGNLECLAESKQGENLLKKPRLKTKLETLNYLKDINLGLACLANNHCYDNLEEGFNNTVSFLSENGINYIGASVSGNENEPYIYKKNGIKIAILNYVTKDTNPNLPKDAKVNPNWFYLKKVEEDIAKLKNKVNYVIVYPHWGGKMEGAKLPDRELIPIAHKIIDAGADLIIGHHSHTLHPYEIYKGKYIFYSLGNFCFSDIQINGKIIEFDKKRSSQSIIVNIECNSRYLYVYYIIINQKSHYLTIDNHERLLYDDRMRIFIPLLHINTLWFLYLFYEKQLYPIIRYFFSNNRNPFRRLKTLNIISIKKKIKTIIYQ